MHSTVWIFSRWTYTQMIKNSNSPKLIIVWLCLTVTIYFLNFLLLFVIYKNKLHPKYVAFHYCPKEPHVISKTIKNNPFEKNYLCILATLKNYLNVSFFLFPVSLYLLNLEFLLYISTILLLWDLSG